MAHLTTPNRRLFILFAAGFFCCTGAVFCQETILSQEPARQRKLSLKHDSPPVIEIVKVSDLNSPEWPNDFTLKLKNIGAKPIYYTMVYMNLPEVEAGGAHWSFPLEFGRQEFFYRNVGELAKPEDESIKPGEIFTLTLQAKHLENYARFLKQLAEARGMPIEVTKVEFDINLINLGDGTGYFGNEPLPQKPRR